MSYTPINWENLPNTTTPVNKTNLNKMDTQIKQNADDIETNTNNISALDTRLTTVEETIEEGIVYQTEEQVIGKWYNGKPLYRKIYEVASLPNNAGMNIPYNISDLEDVVKLSGLATNTAKTVFFPIPFYRTDDNLGIVMYGTGTNIVVITGTDRTELSAYIEIEYTKTTDIVE